MEPRDSVSTPRQKGISRLPLHLYHHFQLETHLCWDLHLPLLTHKHGPQGLDVKPWRQGTSRLHCSITACCIIHQTQVITRLTHFIMRTASATNQQALWNDLADAACKDGRLVSPPLLLWGQLFGNDKLCKKFSLLNPSTKRLWLVGFPFINAKTQCFFFSPSDKGDTITETIKTKMMGTQSHNGQLAARHKWRKKKSLFL